MAKDRGEQDLVPDRTTYRFGPETSQQGPSETPPSESPSTAGDSLESALAQAPAADSSEYEPWEASSLKTTGELGSDTLRLFHSGLSMTPMESPQPGDTIFKKYRVEKLLGRGGMGEVWLVRHEILRDQFALKLIVPGAAIDGETVGRFVLEAQVMRALSRHPHAVVVHDADIDVNRGVIYIVMDVVHGRSIEKLLKPGVAMPLDWTTEVLRQLCDVLQKAHEMGIVHRDLSPANLMIEDSPGESVHLRVLDFGVAKVLDPDSGVFASVPLTENGRFFGKRSYASPEQLCGEGVDARSDIYSIGVILYEFLTGYRPFQGNPQKLMADHCLADPPPFSEMNPDVDLAEVERVVRRCLAKDPNDRPQSALDLIGLFEAAVRETKLGAPPEPETEKKTRDELGGISGEGIRRQPSWRAWVARRRVWLFRASLVLGSLVLVGSALAILVPRLNRGRPSPGHTPIAPAMSAAANAFLKDRQLGLIAGTGISAGGYPTEVERVADRRRFVWRDGIYLPQNYEPDWSKGKAGRLPRALERNDGSRFLLIEGDGFVMGAFDQSKQDFEDIEKPGHRVVLSSFYMQETEVTVQEFEHFCKEKAHDDAALKDGFWDARRELGKGKTDEEVRKHPAVGVTRKLAEAYAHHVGGELPSEAQWEFAARSRGKKRLHVWGDDSPIKKNANVQKTIFEGIGTLPVRLSSDDRTEQGVHDLAGNVREWCRDQWKFYPEFESRRDPVQGPDSNDPNTLFVIRGGSYDAPHESARSTWRHDRAKSGDYDFDLGFRVVLEILEVPATLIAHSESKSRSAGERSQ
jgi:serine/threonine-protein kinase